MSNVIYFKILKSSPILINILNHELPKKNLTAY